jgi:hypothetical protein
METSKKHIFLLRHGTADDIHRALDSGQYLSNTSVRALQDNPEFNRSHVDKLLGGGSHRAHSQAAAAFKIQKHITQQDMDRFISHPDASVAEAVARVSWDPGHFTHLLKSSHGKSPVMAHWVLDMADRRGVLNQKHIDIASQHEDPEVRSLAADMAHKVRR